MKARFSQNENEGDSATICSRIDQQSQRLNANNLKITALETQCAKLRADKEAKRLTLQALQNQIKCFKRPHNEFLMQLKEHCKALKQQLGAELFVEIEMDEIDVDNMTYEELLELEQKMGKVSKGVSKGTFEKLQRVIFLGTESEAKCTICCDDIALESECIALGCKHTFHVECVGEWLKLQKTCPNCKIEIA